MPVVEAAAETALEVDRQSLVRVGGLTKTFHRRGGTVQVLTDVDLTVHEGELLVLLGPSGCGKTTLLRCLVGLERPDTGRIDLGAERVVDTDRGVYVPSNRRDVGMVFQNYALWPHMKVRKNVAYPLKARGMKGALASGRVEEVLQIVQCAHLADRYPPELSGGQQQRVSLARALAPRPSLLLLDEPLSNLDALLRVELRAQLRLLHRQLGFTGVYVTHDQEEAIALGTRVAVMKEGRVEQIGTPTGVYQQPATEYVADFLGARNQLTMHADGDGTVRIAGQSVRNLARPDLLGDYRLRVRDPHIKIRPRSSVGVSDRTVWLTDATVVEVLPGTEAAECMVEIGGTRVFAAVPNDALSVDPGETVDVGLDLAKTLCFEPDGAAVADWSTATGRRTDHDLPDVTAGTRVSEGSRT